MTLGELISEGLIKDNERIQVEINYPNGRAACVWKGNWFQDHILNLTDIELSGISWSRESGWKLHGIVQEETE